jgi:hypothetical protein
LPFETEPLLREVDVGRARVFHAEAAGRWPDVFDPSGEARFRWQSFAEAADRAAGYLACSLGDSGTVLVTHGA